MRETCSTLWFYWKRFGHRLGLIQTEVILTLSYLIIFGPGRLILVSSRSDPLHKRAKRTESLYAPKEPAPMDLELYRNQF